ncbi:Ribonuclease R [Botrimarina colliarenosi]|uniref:Ribonuclease R n=1 Tax=Botrimarina colliarenosi TaxID=2528001 RepID=A0A5C6AHZ2_9BACT|nr:ribonuclease R [Botrimarina colliarenosi]TWT99107.1 Ribonuclease R [Botrimarina colliarenosi]
MQDELRAAILSYTSNAAYRAVKPKVIAERLGLEGDKAADAKKLIKKMIREGELEFGPNHLVLPVEAGHPSRVGLAMPSETPPSETPSSDGPSAEANGAQPEAGDEKPKKRRGDSKYVVGTLRRISSGDAFVRPQGTPPSAERDLDIFVPEKQSGDAANGDIVRLSLSSRPGPRGKATGKVVDIVERATSTFVGTYVETDGMAMVEIDGKVFGDPIYVGDPGAKGAKEGDKVVIDMVRFPSQVRNGEAVITRVLGDRGAPGVDTLSIKYEYDLPGDFPEEVLEDSRKQAALFDESIPAGRRDLTGEVIVTIDPLTARDFDDAISLKKLSNGHWELGVHIADVSHFVQPKSPLDREAYDRATSVYLPDEVVPMLPEIISNNLASLQPDHIRYAMTAVLEMTADGAAVHCEVFKSAIKSRRRFTYEEVDGYLVAKKLVGPDSPLAGQPGSLPEGLSPEVDQLLGQMFELAMILRKRRFERGALELSMPEVKIDLDKEGRVSGAHVEQNTESHQVIEEFMLAANIAVAHKLADAGLLFLRRVHGSPDPRKSRALTEFIRSLGMPVDNLQDRFELQEVLNSVKGDPRQHAVNFATLRSMQKAVYSPEDEGHYALAADCYCHFTSPIRRYPDLTIHRLLEALNQHQAGAGPKPVNEMATLVQQGDHCSDREGRAAGAERELKKVKLLNYLSDKIGLEMDGVITGVEKFGVFIMGRDMPAEGFIHITALGDDYYNFDRASHSIVGRRAGNAFRLGDAVRVVVANVDVDSRELDFRYLGRASGPGLRPAHAKPDKGSRGGGGRKGRPLPAEKKRRPSQGKNRQARERSAGQGKTTEGGKASASGDGGRAKPKPAKGKKKTPRGPGQNRGGGGKKS